MFKKRKKVFNHPRRSLAEPFWINFNSFQLGLKRFLNQLDHWCKYKCDSFNEYSFRNWNLPTRQNKLNETQQLGLTKQFSRTQGLIHIFFIFIETEVIYSDELSVLKSSYWRAFFSKSLRKYFKSREKKIKQNKQKGSREENNLETVSIFPRRVVGSLNSQANSLSSILPIARPSNKYLGRC